MLWHNILMLIKVIIFLALGLKVRLSLFAVVILKFKDFIIFNVICMHNEEGEVKYSVM
jgi:hypothetical protein